MVSIKHSYSPRQPSALCYMNQQNWDALNWSKKVPIFYLFLYVVTFVWLNCLTWYGTFILGMNLNCLYAGLGRLHPGHQGRRPGCQPLHQWCTLILFIAVDLQYDHYRAQKIIENDLQDVSSALEKKDIEAAFLQEEKEDAEKLAEERWNRLEQINEKLMKLEGQRDDFQVCTCFGLVKYYTNFIGAAMYTLHRLLLTEPALLVVFGHGCKIQPYV